MSSSALFVHVPVDKVIIPNGPGAVKWIQLIAQLDEIKGFELCDLEPYVMQAFTLRTAASTRTFRGKLKMATVSPIDRDYSSEFTALFSGCIVSGVYNIQARSGWFSLD